MEACKNHPEKWSSFKCTSCAASLCMDCYDRRLINQDRKQLGFCSTDCRQAFLDKQTLRKGKNRKKGYDYLITGICAIVVGIIWLKIVVPYAPAMDSIKHWPYMQFIINPIFFIFIGGGVVSLIYGISVLYGGYDPNMFTLPIVSKVTNLHKRPIKLTEQEFVHKTGELVKRVHVVEPALAYHTVETLGISKQLAELQSEEPYIEVRMLVGRCGPDIDKLIYNLANHFQILQSQKFAPPLFLLKKLAEHEFVSPEVFNIFSENSQLSHELTIRQLLHGS